MIERLGLGGREEQIVRLAVRRLEAASALGACTIMPNPQLLLLDTSRRRGWIPRRGANLELRSTRSPAEGLTVLVSTHYMDEAERCHEIAYLAYGELLARGTVEEVIAHSGLVTYVVSGEEPAKLAAALDGKPGRDGRAVRHQLAYLRS